MRFYYAILFTFFHSTDKIYDTLKSSFDVRRSDENHLFFYPFFFIFLTPLSFIEIWLLLFCQIGDWMNWNRQQEIREREILFAGAVLILCFNWYCINLRVYSIMCVTEIKLLYDNGPLTLRPPLLYFSHSDNLFIRKMRYVMVSRTRCISSALYSY